MDIHQNARLTLRSREQLVASVSRGMRFSRAARLTTTLAKETFYAECPRWPSS